MMRYLRTALAVVAMSLTLVCCKDDTDDHAMIFLGTAETAPAAGVKNARVEMQVFSSKAAEVTVTPDGTVVTSAAYADPYIIYTVSENKGEQRTGHIFIRCGSASRILDIVQSAVPAVSLHEWPELPKVMDGADKLIHYSHSQLPSDKSKRNYSFCFDSEHHASLWVAYPLHSCYLGSASRTDSFDYDYAFASFTNDSSYSMQANVSGAYYSEYGNTNSIQYSRGHQLPSADRTATAADNITTFYATNMTPQLQSLNGGAWEKLESLVRESWICSDTLYVVTGAIFDDDHLHAYDNRSLGKLCSVPTHYYKVLLRTKNGASGKKVSECSASELKCIGFILKHDSSRSSKSIYKTDACSVSDLEKRTGMTFFVNVPNAPKTTYNTSEWSGVN